MAEQLRAWFDALSYKFEKDEINNENYFEWIINVINPVGKKRYNRVLVRGITKEAGMPDVAALRQSVNARKTDVGWLITNRRVSPGHEDWVLSVAFSPDGQRIVSGSDDETIRIWDATTGDCLRVISYKLCAGLNITGVIGLTSAQRVALKLMGAIDN
ncbi:MAG: WD40 repeat domain-containing protein [Nostoc sp.]|uniref:WD40 repeat domain-containing protein n=1 Tax=Nostoc sp. TaxID=1180 RepID=UPI002FF19DC9